MRNPQGQAAARLAEYGDAGVCVSIVTACELRFGAFWKYRVGDYRIIAAIGDEVVTVLMLRIGNPPQRS